MNANVRAAAAAFATAGLLSEFHTTLDTTRLAARAPTSSLRRAFERRAIPPAFGDLIATHPLVEVSRLVLQRLLSSSVQRVAAIDASSRTIDRAIARRVSWGTTGVYAYEDAAIQSFRKATDFDVPRIYELPIGYWREGESIFSDEIARNPEWASTFTNRNVRNDAQRKERKDKEIALASTVIVASRFTASTLDSFPGGARSVVCIPYGCPPVSTRDPGKVHNGPLRVLYVGGLTQRKGLSYLFDAMELVGSAATLTIIGSRAGESPARDRALARHDWRGSLPHSRVLEAMRWHDLLVFPSLFEGFGMVITEALSQGLPVITTSHTAGPDFITEGEEGWIVPIRSAEAIADRIMRADRDREMLRWMKGQALLTAGGRPWGRYMQELVEAVSGILRVGDA